MNRLSSLLIYLLLAFIVPVTGLIIIPAIRTSRLTPIPYDAEADGRGSQYPDMRTDTRGLSVYQREGCAYCHTQVIRTEVAGYDSWKKGWGADQGARPEAAIRPTTQWDYLGTNDAQLGWMRNGSDLSNVGYRITDPMALHMLLYNSRAQHRESTMPSFRHLYVTRKIEGQKSDEALPLEGKDEPAYGMEVVPGEDAVALVEYLRSLKKDSPLPAELRNRMILNK